MSPYVHLTQPSRSEFNINQRKKTNNHNFDFQEVHVYKVPKAGYSLNEIMIEFEKKRSYIEKISSIH